MPVLWLNSQIPYDQEGAVRDINAHLRHNQLETKKILHFVRFEHSVL